MDHYIIRCGLLFLFFVAGCGSNASEYYEETPPETGSKEELSTPAVTREATRRPEEDLSRGDPERELRREATPTPFGITEAEKKDRKPIVDARTQMAQKLDDLGLIINRSGFEKALEITEEISTLYAEARADGEKSGRGQKLIETMDKFKEQLDKCIHYLKREDRRNAKICFLNVANYNRDWKRILTFGQ